MDNLQWYDFMRLLTAVINIAAMYRLALNLRLVEAAGGEVVPSKHRDFIWYINAALLTQAAGAIEAAIQDTPYRTAAVLSFIISLVAFHATRRDEDLPAK